MSNRLKFFIVYCFLIIFLSGCSDTKNDEYSPKYSEKPIFVKQTYIFGVHPLHNPKKLFEVYQPLVDYINHNIPSINLKLEASRNYEAYNKKLFSSYFDLALPNPYQTVQSLKHGYTIFGKMGDDENFKGIILVRKDGNIHTIEDLKGKTVSYPAATALAATMLPQYFLYKHGIDVNKDIKNSYVGSQESSIMNLFLKKSVAAATWPPPWEAFKKDRPTIANKLTVKWETQSLPNNGLVAKNSMPKELVNEIATLLFNLHTTQEGKDILKPMELSKFEKANTETYNQVEWFLEKFEKEVRTIGGTK